MATMNPYIPFAMILTQATGILPQPALACSLCVLSLAEYTAPPFILWCIWAFSWFLAMSVLGSVARTKLPLVPRLPWAVALAAGAILLGGAVLGFLSVIPLAIAPAAAFALSFRRASNSAWGTRVRLAVRVVGYAGCFSGLLLLSLGANARSERSDVEFMCNWPGSPITSSLIRMDPAPDAASLELYRSVLRQPDCKGAWRAAKPLSLVGRPEIDVPLMEEALRHTARGAGMDFEREMIEEAIRDLRARSKDLPARPAS